MLSGCVAVSTLYRYVSQISQVRSVERAGTRAAAVVADN